MAADEVADISRGGDGRDGGYNGNNEQPSMLSGQDNDAMQHKEMKVVNPWIHEATHKEYLENVKV
jgi:hypothetical protein